MSGRMSEVKIPWTEKLCPFRAPLDILTGCYPAFVFGGPLSGKILPVFHFHEVTPQYLEPYLRYLSDNGYRGATGAELIDFVEARSPISEKTVLLTFDDAWTSLWTVAAPLLRKYGLHAMTFAIPGRVSIREGLRPNIDDDPNMVDFGDQGSEPFCRWDELIQLDREGVIEVESHTYAHEQIIVGDAEDSPVWTDITLRNTPLLSRPLLWTSDDSFRPIDDRDIGKPRGVTRSRMSNGLMTENGIQESKDQQREAIRDDLSRCRSVFAERMKRESEILCFPWAVAGQVAREAAKGVGFRIAFSDSFPGKRYVHPKADPYRLMRLKHNWIFNLPGQGRRKAPIPK